MMYKTGYTIKNSAVDACQAALQTIPATQNRPKTCTPNATSLDELTFQSQLLSCKALSRWTPQLSVRSRSP
eukprot:3935504-Rhodomonas_salina.3